MAINDATTIFNISLANENENVDGVMGMKIIKQQNFQTT
jgi:hypothetical protein